MPIGKNSISRVAGKTAAGQEKKSNARKSPTKVTEAAPNEEPKVFPVEEALSTEITIAAPAKEPAVKSAKRISEEEMATVTKVTRPGRPPKASRPAPAKETPKAEAEEKEKKAPAAVEAATEEAERAGHPTACRINDPMPDYLL